MEQHSLDLVIASYREQIDWAREFAALPAMRVYIYNTGGRPYDFGIVTHLPNVGREMGQYLWHLVNRYGEFADFVLFTQANPFDRCEWLRDVIRSGKFASAEYLPMGFMDDYFPARACPFWESPESDIYLTGLRFYLELTGKPLPVHVPYPHGAVFSISRERLMRHPKSYYLDIYQRLMKINCAAWAMECLWELIL